ncbi:hypothetical protein [Pararhodobacter zhoushanensis]|uniref:Uncharacterized protein n=1 Tax=Pararhodobacter zhoushanensis TaxID=2479545 RepID=A0ABT3H0X1_9RHOB|nr:hypothetical protein [Pararhodobacter zhoushanensis]MCW1933421.1 hypothetical protein [Pararhodobacter zhoushanensis]
MTDALPVLLFIAAVMVGVGVLIWRSQQIEKRRRAAYQVFADQRGLTYTQSKARGGPTVFTFADGARGLTLTVTRSYSKSSNGKSRSSPGHTKIQMADPRLPGGIALYTPEMAAGVADAASKVMGIFDNSLSKMLLGKLLGDDIGAYLGEMHDQPAPEGVALTIMATVNPNPLFDARLIEHALSEIPAARNAERKTMVLITENGLQIRAGRDFREVAEIERFLDIAQTLQAALRR